MRGPAVKSQTTTYPIPTQPLPLHLGQVSIPSLSARVRGALGLASKGSFLGTFPVPWQSGQVASITPLALAFRFRLPVSIITLSRDWLFSSNIPQPPHPKPMLQMLLPERRIECHQTRIPGGKALSGSHWWGQAARTDWQS